MRVVAGVRTIQLCPWLRRLERRLWLVDHGRDSAYYEGDRPPLSCEKGVWRKHSGDLARLQNDQPQFMPQFQRRTVLLFHRYHTQAKTMRRFHRPEPSSAPFSRLTTTILRRTMFSQSQDRSHNLPQLRNSPLSPRGRAVPHGVEPICYASSRLARSLAASIRLLSRVKTSLVSSRMSALTVRPRTD